MSIPPVHVPPPPLVAADAVPTEDGLVLRPLIASLLRSRICVPDAVFLVEGVDPHISVGEGNRAIRLLLGDGDLCLQALLGPDLHVLCDSGVVSPGCYVRLGQYQLHSISLYEREEDVTRAAEVKLGDGNLNVDVGDGPGGAQRPGEMVCLLIQSLETIGWSNTYLRMLRLPPKPAVEGLPVLKTPTREARAPWADQHPPEGPPVASPATELILKPVASQVAVAATQSLPRGEVDGEDSGLDDAFESMEVSETKIAQRRAQLATFVSNRTKDGRPAQPLKLTPLRSIPNLPYKQNWSVNVLAVVASLSEIQPSHLPPHTQRVARLADPTTAKQVLLTVFLEPEAFAPKVGSVVLLLGVKNHMFDGGCLKKYVSDQSKDGAPWWIEDPRDLEWCDVAGLRSWWDGL